MKTNHSARGVALVIVLGFLVLLSGLAIAFFSSVTTELGASRTYSNNVTTRQLSDSAVNLVMGQIREATSRPNGAWGSQPGMIRVYRNSSGQAGSNADAFFKLYSAKNMVVLDTDMNQFDPNDTPTNFDAGKTHQDVPRNWDELPGLFTDLNSPVITSDPNNPGAAGKPVFPILDPRAKANVDGIKAQTEEEKLVEGFDYSPDVNKAKDSGGSDEWRVPMPVRWIYVLRDGTLTTPDKEYSGSGGATGAQWTGSATDFRTPTKDNPVVGRIAFWADDDTSKININTAGGRGKVDSALQSEGYDDDISGKMNYAGSFWDTPRFYTNFDIGQVNPSDGTLIPGVGAGGLAATQPWQKEFQRYPGHPATTSLGAVFSRLLTSEQIYKLAPRLNGGGSVGGTIRTEKAVAKELELKTERLYASLDELLFSAKPVNGGKRETNDNYVGVSGAVTPDKLERMKFFLTAHSRSPDLNLFGRPRVAIWPVAQVTSEQNPVGRNGFDRAIAYCSTIGGQRYIFTRFVGGGSAQNGSASMTQDISATNRSSNKVLLQYLRDLTDQRIPGFGGRFVDKYGVQNRDAILGQIFDYIRIANLRDTTTGMTNYQYSKFGVVAPSRANLFGTGQRVGGFGRCATISEATICFYVSGVSTDGNTFVQTEIPENQKQGISHRMIRAFVFFSTFDPMQGYAPKVTSPPGATDADRERYRQIFEVTGLDSFQINGQPLGFPSKATNKILAHSGETWAGRNFAGYEGFMHTMRHHGTPGTPFPGSNPPGNSAYELHSGGAVKVAVNDGTFSFSGGDLELKIYLGSVSTSQLMQTIKLRFPGGSWPLPERWYRINKGGFVNAEQNPFNVSDDASGNPGSGNPAMVEQAQNLLNFGTMRGRINWVDLHASDPNAAGMYAGGRWAQIIQPGDIVRSLVYGSSNASSAAPTRDGDLRYLMLTENVPVTEFTAHPDYDSPTLRFACGLRAADGSLYVGANMPYWPVDAPADQQKGKALVEPATTFAKHVSSGVAINANKAMTLPMSKVPGGRGLTTIRRADNKEGDFDTGMGTFADGPYASKQDEGNVIYKYFDNNLQKWIYPIPYAATHSYETPGDIFYSPNRQMPSAVLFGSLLSRPKEPAPDSKDRRQWETLAFCPNTAGAAHPGNTESPRDHLLLDLFTMPFVEPYLISEPLSTAGRVNLNYQIAPFGYIKRSTALRAALHPLRVTAVKSTLLNTYKSGLNSKPLANPVDNPRLEIDRDQTLAALDAPGGFFDQYKTDRNKGFFKSATEICERFLYPKGSGLNINFTGSLYDPDPNGGKTGGESSITQFWSQRKLTGDNVREKPYADLYPRITTKSNTYTVHMRVQTIRQVGVGGDFTKWQEGRDVVLGEYRGATTIERYIDPSEKVKLPLKADPTVKDSEKQSLEDLYRFRVVDTKKFTP